MTAFCTMKDILIVWVQELALKLDVSEDDINMTVAYFTKMWTDSDRR